VKKISDNYGKESSQIAGAIDSITNETDNVEKQIRRMLVPYEAAAKTSPLLSDACGRIKTALA